MLVSGILKQSSSHWWVFDMDGVLRIGDHLIKSADNILCKVEKAGLKSIIITNECRYTSKEIANDLTEIGMNIPDHVPIITSGMCVCSYLEQKIQRFSDENIIIGIVGESGLHTVIESLSRYKNVEITETVPKYKNRSYLIIGSLNKIKISNLEKVLSWIKAGARVIVTCDDISDPSSKGDFSLGMPSHILHMVKFNITATSYALGKPHPIVARKIAELVPDIDASEILVVGDTIYTDIRLAEENGYRSALVLTGNTKTEGIKKYVTEADIVLSSINDISKALDVLHAI